MSCDLKLCGTTRVPEVEPLIRRGAHPLAQHTGARSLRPLPRAETRTCVRGCSRLKSAATIASACSGHSQRALAAGTRSGHFAVDPATAPPRSADSIQLSVAPESECRARGYAIQFTVY